MKGLRFRTNRVFRQSTSAQFRDDHQPDSLVHAKSSPGVIGLRGLSLEVLEVLPSPKHGDTLNAEGGGIIGAVGRPGVQPGV